MNNIQEFKIRLEEIYKLKRLYTISNLNKESNNNLELLLLKINLLEQDINFYNIKIKDDVFNKSVYLLNILRDNLDKPKELSGYSIPDYIALIDRNRRYITKKQLNPIKNQLEEIKKNLVPINTINSESNKHLKKHK